MVLILILGFAWIENSLPTARNDQIFLFLFYFFIFFTTVLKTTVCLKTGAPSN